MYTQLRNEVLHFDIFMKVADLMWNIILTELIVSVHININICPTGKYIGVREDRLYVAMPMQK